MRVLNSILPPMETTLMVRDYCGNHIYRDGVLERVQGDYGNWAGGSWYYHVKDYQGNVRAVIDGQDTLEEVRNYYPYGGLMGGGTLGSNQSVQPYKYGTKELDRQNGLDWYDSQARMYDPLLGRTPTMDSKAEDYYYISPYAWCVGNPIKFVDTNGKWIKGSNGKRIKLNKKDRVWSKNTSEDIQRIGDAMMMTEHGMQKLDDMLNSPFPISLQLNKTDIIKYDNGDVKLGGTTPWLIRDKKGKAIDFKRVEIVIYLKAIQEYGSNDSRYKGLSEDEIIGANAVHESTHGTEKEANNNFNESDGQAEDKAKQSEEEYIKQLNEKKSKEEVQQ